MRWIMGLALVSSLVLSGLSVAELRLAEKLVSAQQDLRFDLRKCLIEFAQYRSELAAGVESTRQLRAWQSDFNDAHSELLRRLYGTVYDLDRAIAALRADWEATLESEQHFRVGVMEQIRSAHQSK